MHADPLTWEIETCADPVSWSSIPCDSQADGAPESQRIPAPDLVSPVGEIQMKGDELSQRQGGYVQHVSRSHFLGEGRYGAS